MDGLGRPIVSATETTVGQWSRTDSCFDALGRKSFASYPYYSSSNGGAAACAQPGDSFQFDPLGRETVETHSDNTTFLTSYAGRATETQDEGNGTARVTRIAQINGLGQLSSVCEVTFSNPPEQGPSPSACSLDIPATGFLTTYLHDALGNLTSVTQGAEARNFSFDGLSRMVYAANPETGATRWVYDHNTYCTEPDAPGDMVERINPSQVAVCYSWDPLHRVTQKRYTDGTPTVLFYYDSSLGWNETLQNPIGRLSREWSGTTGVNAAAETFSYDSMGRVAVAQQCAPNTCGWSWEQAQYTFDKAGEPTNVLNVGSNLSITYDPAGRPLSLTSSNQGALVSNAAFDARGNELSATLGNGVAEYREFDPRGRTTYVQDDALYTLGHANYSGDGNLVNSSDSANGTFTYAFTDQNQLGLVCSPDCTGSTENYAFDRYGNRWSQHGSLGPAQSLGFTGANNRVDGWSYDANGNLLNDGTHSYTYDAENRLISVDGGATASYVYDAEGRRVHESVGGVVKEYVYGQSGQELTVVDANQNLLAGETYFSGRYLGTQNPGGFVWAFSDELGTVRARADSHGAPLEADTSGPWGEPTSLQSATSQVHFTAKLFDPETNLSYFGARYYSPSLGRFLTPDWSQSPQPVPYANIENPQSLNLYSYVLNNPVTRLDPDGHDCCFGWASAAYRWISGYSGWSTTSEHTQTPPLPSPPPAPPVAELKTSIRGNTTTFQTYSAKDGYRELDFKSLVKADSKLSQPGAGDPYAGAVVGVRTQSVNDVSFGPAGGLRIITNDERARFLHGGGTSLGKHAFDPYQRLTATLGCTRMCNADLVKLGSAIREFASQHPGTPILYQRVWQ